MNVGEHSEHLNRLRCTQCRRWRAMLPVALVGAKLPPAQGMNPLTLKRQTARRRIAVCVAVARLTVMMVLMVC